MKKLFWHLNELKYLNSPKAWAYCKLDCSKGSPNPLWFFTCFKWKVYGKSPTASQAYSFPSIFSVTLSSNCLICSSSVPHSTRCQHRSPGPEDASVRFPLAPWAPGCSSLWNTAGCSPSFLLQHCLKENTGNAGRVMKYYFFPGNSQNFSSGGTEAVEPHVAARRLGASSAQGERSPEPTTVGGSPYGGTTLPGAESTLREVKARYEAAAGLPPHRSSPSSRGAGWGGVGTEAGKEEGRRRGRWGRRAGGPSPHGVIERRRRHGAEARRGSGCPGGGGLAAPGACGAHPLGPAAAPGEAAEGKAARGGGGALR